MRPEPIEAPEAALPRTFQGRVSPADDSYHPHRSQLERFLRSELPPREILPIVRHLLTGCPACTPVTRQLWELEEGTR